MRLFFAILLVLQSATLVRSAVLVLPLKSAQEQGQFEKMLLQPDTLNPSNISHARLRNTMGSFSHAKLRERPDINTFWALYGAIITPAADRRALPVLKTELSKLVPVLYDFSKRAKHYPIHTTRMPVFAESTSRPKAAKRPQKTKLRLFVILTSSALISLVIHRSRHAMDQRTGYTYTAAMTPSIYRRHWSNA